MKRVKKLKWVADGVKHSVSLLWIWYDALHFLSSSTNRFLEFFYFTKICGLHPTQMHCHCTLIFISWKYLFDFPSRKILSLCSISDLIGENPLFRRYNKRFFHFKMACGQFTTKSTQNSTYSLSKYIFISGHNQVM